MVHLAKLCLFSVVTVGLPSQATILVGPGGLPTIQVRPSSPHRVTSPWQVAPVVGGIFR